MSEKIYTEPIKYNVGDRGNYFKKKYNLFNYCASFSLIVLLGSAFFTGSFDTRYSQNITNYQYIDYKGDTENIDVYNYEWSNKLKQLSKFKNIFDVPNINQYGDSIIFNTLENAQEFEKLFDYGLLSWSNTASIKVLNQSFGGNLAIGSILIPKYTITTNWSWSDSGAMDSVINGILTIDEVNVYKQWYNDIGAKVGKYFTYASELQLANNYYDVQFSNPLEPLQMIFDILVTPLRWGYNSLYDFGVAVSFITNW